MSGVTYLPLLAGLSLLWLVAENGYHGYETETALGETEGGVATIEFVVTAGRIQRNWRSCSVYVRGATRGR